MVYVEGVSGERVYRDKKGEVEKCEVVWRKERGQGEWGE